MKTSHIIAMLALICLQANPATAQETGNTYPVPLPAAGQTLPDNSSFTPFLPGNREIDFDSLDMAFTGNWPAGQSFSISASPTGDTLFVGEGGMLDVLDITDPYNPVLVTQIRARAIIDGSYYDPSAERLYLAAYFSGIEVWDVSDFSAPARISRIPTTSYPRGGVFARDNYVYIVTVADGFWVADISDPDNPVMVGHRTIPGNPLIWNSAFQGNLAYLAADNSGMKIIDFTNPANPVIAGNYNGMVSGVCVRDTLGFIASSNLGLRVVNITDPTNITLEGYCNIPGYPYRVTVSGNYAYVANFTTDQGGVNVVDISVPDVPALVATYPGFQTYIAGQGDAIGATGGVEGCLVLDVSDPLLPLQAYAMPLAGFTYEVAVEGNFGYTGSNGFRVFDLSDMSNPVQVGFHEADGALVAIRDTVAVYIRKSMTANNPVMIMDISDPYNPMKTGQYMAPVMTYDLALKDQYAFVACWWDGFRVVDFSNPAAPALKAHEFGWVNGAVPGEDFCYVQALDIYENYLYLVDYQPFSNEDTKGLYVFDISDPINPQFISRYPTLLSTAQDIKALGNYVYVADGTGGLEVIDVSDPYLPASVGYCSLPDGANGVDVSWPFVFVGDYILGGVQVVDVTVPSAPFVTAYYTPSGVFAQGVTVKDNFVVAGDGVCGFQVYDLLSATGIGDPEVASAFGLSVYPNPARGSRHITFNLEQPSLVAFNILDLQGRKLQSLLKDKFEAGSHSVVFNDQNLTSGIYFLEMTTPIDKKAVRFIVK
jgi:hypothetical protein